MVKDAKKWVIFGCSPQIEEVKEVIPFLQERYTTIGLNHFPIFYPDVDYWFFLDSNFVPSGLASNHKGQKIVTLIDSIPDLVKCKIKPYHTFVVAARRPLKRSDKALLGTQSSVLPAIHYAWANGADEVYLVGIRLNPEWEHFYGPALPEPKLGIEKIAEKLNELSGYVKIYRTDPLMTLAPLELVDVTKL